MNYDQILTILAVAIGPLSALGGIWLGSWLDKNKKREELIFISKEKAYSRLIGVFRKITIINQYSDGDIEKVSELASSAMLYANDDLREIIKDIANNLHKKMEPFFTGGGGTFTVSDLNYFRKKIKHLEREMKKELGISIK